MKTLSPFLDESTHKPGSLGHFNHHMKLYNHHVDKAVSAEDSKRWPPKDSTPHWDAADEHRDELYKHYGEKHVERAIDNFNTSNAAGRKTAWEHVQKYMKEDTNLQEAKATYCGRCGTRHVPPSKGGTCPALKETSDNYNTNIKETKMKTLHQFMQESVEHLELIGEAEDHLARVKKMVGQNVSFTHATTGDKVKGELKGIKRMGGMPYAHVETGKKAHMVPLHQID